MVARSSAAATGAEATTERPPLIALGQQHGMAVQARRDLPHGRIHHRVEAVGGRQSTGELKQCLCPAGLPPRDRGVFADPRSERAGDDRHADEGNKRNDLGRMRHGQRPARFDEADVVGQKAQAGRDHRREPSTCQSRQHHRGEQQHRHGCGETMSSAARPAAVITPTRMRATRLPRNQDGSDAARNNGEVWLIGGKAHPVCGVRGMRRHRSPYSTIWVPISTTRPVGIWKYSVASAAFRDSQMKSRSPNSGAGRAAATA